MNGPAAKVLIEIVAVRGTIIEKIVYGAIPMKKVSARNQMITGGMLSNVSTVIPNDRSQMVAIDDIYLISAYTDSPHSTR